MNERMRQPILGILRKSPFTGLLKHAEKVKECIAELDKVIKSYCEEDYVIFEKHVKRVRELEGEADLIKGNTRNHLPKFIFLPVEKADFLKLLREDDAILDHAEDVAVLMSMRYTKIPDDIKEDLLALSRKVIETCEYLVMSLSQFRELLESSFMGQKRIETKKRIYSIHEKEHEADLIESKITKKIFNSTDLDPISIIHLLKIVHRIGKIADNAENAGDRIRAMIAK